MVMELSAYGVDQRPGKRWIDHVPEQGSAFRDQQKHGETTKKIQGKKPVIKFLHRVSSIGFFIFYTFSESQSESRVYGYVNASKIQIGETRKRSQLHGPIDILKLPRNSLTLEKKPNNLSIF